VAHTGPGQGTTAGEISNACGVRQGRNSHQPNATEALNTVIFGLNLKPGDEVIGTKQDYPNMINAWRQRAAREGIIYKQISFDFPVENDETIVEAYEKAITPKPKSYMSPILSIGLDK
jgi:selenocysteine lyase/cysteine desulfurase